MCHTCLLITHVRKTLPSLLTSPMMLHVFRFVKSVAKLIFTSIFKKNVLENLENVLLEL